MEKEYNNDNDNNDIISYIENLEIKNKELEESNKILENFAYYNAHDLKSPLRSINGLTELLIDYNPEGLNSEVKEYLKLLKFYSDRVIELVDSSLKYSTIGKELNVENLNLYNIVSQILLDLENVIPKIKQADIYIDIPNNVYIDADKSLFIHLFQNLISNALKFNDKTIPTLHIKHMEEDKYYNIKDKKIVYHNKIIVKDNGLGINEEYKYKIFDAFYRLYSDTDEYGGVGLGLAIVKKIIDKHNWIIEVENNNPDPGTTFIILCH